jgi:phosphatidylserine decarboxylase
VALSVVLRPTPLYELASCVGELDYWDRQLTPDQARQIFAETFVCDPTRQHWGFDSWDAFFTRTFREGQRPVAAPGEDHVVANACESAPYALKHKVKKIDHFWTKGQPYSLRHMLADDGLAAKFVGGTVYQAFLSAKAYHRWHSPVSGTVAKSPRSRGRTTPRSRRKASSTRSIRPAPATRRRSPTRRDRTTPRATSARSRPAP